jgi:glycosidase
MFCEIIPFSLTIYYNINVERGVTMSSSKLEKLYNLLTHANDKRVFNYTVPDLWNCFDYDKASFIKTPSNELMVNPYDFYASVIKQAILPKRKNSFNYGKSLSSLLQTKPTNGNWIKKAVMYSTLVRASAAWDHDRSGHLEEKNLYGMPETGSFVKMIALLPLLVKMGVNAIYLLPISRFSTKNKKGELGSPYGVTHFTELDPGLKDPLTSSSMTLEEEFQAFVEACHILNIRVLIDIIPRTNSVDSALIREHPEWFYWIDASMYDTYGSPRIDTISPNTIPSLENMKKVYEHKATIRHLNMFRPNPKAIDEKLWEKIKKHEDLAGAIEKYFNLKVAPAFSDYINDPQPPWTDVTFFRMYLDHPKQTKTFLDNQNRPPFILFDTIKNDMYQGQKPNIELWNLISEVIPYYQKQFGIDGARIDMGHALSDDLLKMIMDKARAIDPDFAFIAEELQPSKAKAAKKAGYNAIIGNGFYMEPRVWEGKMQEFFYNSINLPIPTLAMGESHDTPRLSARDGGESLARLLTIVNMFMPGGIPFINSGQEVYEKQPMNLGLDARENEQYQLDVTDPFYGKLALFDRYQFHYTNDRRWEIPDLLDAIRPIRKRYLPQITSKKQYFPLYAHYENKNFVGFSYFKKTKTRKNNILFILANADTWHEHYIRIDISHLREVTGNKEMEGKLLLSTHEGPRLFTQFIDYNTLDIHLGPGEVKIVEL